MYGLTSRHCPHDIRGYFKLVHPDDLDQVKASLDRSLKRALPFEIEKRIVRLDGHTRWVHMQGVLLRDASGKPEKMLGGVMDTSRRHQLEEQAQHAQRMEVIGQLTAGIAHNFNNMLMGILPNLELAIRRAPSELVPLLKNAEHAGRRASDVVRQLMTFAGTITPRRSVESIPALVSSTLDLCRRTFPANIDIEVIHENIPDIAVDPSQLEHALLNIVLNARDAVLSSKKSAPAISVALSMHDVVRPPHENQPGRYLRIEVVDNGCGMSDETKRRIFEPFFTTKGPGSGTGLGLATAFAIIREHQGWIDVASTEGVGSTFSLYLPATPSMSITQADAAHSEHEAPRGTELILIVDDEPMVRMILGDLLEEAGYQTLAAENGDTAVAVVRQHVGKIALAILDLSMPGKPGNIVLRMIREIDPAIRFMFSTGQIPDAKLIAEASAVLEKPFDSTVLRETVRRVIDGK
ncbi:MAG: ATP-binding protein [Polyangiaceae bacterium]